MPLLITVLVSHHTTIVDTAARDAAVPAVRLPARHNPDAALQRLNLDLRLAMRAMSERVPEGDVRSVPALQ